MQKFFSISVFIFILSSASLSAQNEFEVSNFQSPLPIHYQSNAAEPIRIFVVNKGPNVITANDSLFIEFNVATNDSTIFFTKTMPVGKFLNIEDGNDYTLDSSYSFPDNFFSICAGIIGSKAYPVNVAKQGGACIRLTVGLEENPLKVNSLYYSHQQIHYFMQNAVHSHLQLFDLQGRLLFQKELDSEEGTFNFSARSGLYLIRLKNKKGQTTSAKLFVP